MFYHIFGPRDSGGYDYKSGDGFCRFLTVLIFFMAVSVVIAAAGRWLAAAWKAKGETNVKNIKIGVCLMLVGGLSLYVLYGYFTKGIRKTGHVNWCRAFEFFGGRFKWFRESDVRPRHFQSRRIEGPGRIKETCNLRNYRETSCRPEGWWDIYIYIYGKVGHAPSPHHLFPQKNEKI